MSYKHTNRLIEESSPYLLQHAHNPVDWYPWGFEDERIARLLNKHFVAVKVDREQRPDVDETYMLAVQAMTGSGGWPLSVFLAPDGKPFYGRYPTDQKWLVPHFEKMLYDQALLI